jgi:SAM-dependent methyltransferase
MNYINHFGEQAADYLQFRPDYPDTLYAYLSSLVKEHDLVWDCGTGNGQAASNLAGYFKKVIGTDINQKQLDVAIKKDNIYYHCWPAEKTDIAGTTVDLITVAQALHWFNFDEFYREVLRVAKPNGIIAAWCYSLGRMNPEVNQVMDNLYYTILGDTYWPGERKYIDHAYRTIPFPFEVLLTPAFFIEKKMNFVQLVGYLNTWSACKEYQKRNQKNPLELIYATLQTAWGDRDMQHIMRWPIHLRVGRINLK